MSAVLKLDESYSGYTLDDKRNAFAQYMVHGNLMQVVRNTGIPHSTLRDWQNDEWWVTEAARVREQTSADLDVKLTQLIDVAARNILDRLENGDHKLTKDGEIVRVPVSAKDSAVTMAIVFDKRQIARSLPTHISASTGQLDALADNLKKLRAEGVGTSDKQVKSKA